MKNTLFSLWFSALLLISLSAGAQSFKPEDTIRTDPSVRIGKLENGITYYIRQNKKPENRIELRLAVNAGSMQENESQKGLAHFTEHMCFNGTKNFPKNQLIDYLQKTGVKFGADINAYTSFDETVYMLQLPADNQELVDKGFQVLEDWAHNVTFDDNEIDKERGVIVEEWRLGLGADDRIRKKYFPIVFKGSRYAERMPIGDVEILKTFKYDTIRQFYKDWYRPDLQAVIVVGDIDPDLAEQKIKQHFAGLKMPAQPRPRVMYDIPGNVQPLIAVATDKEATATSIMVFFKQAYSKIVTVADFRGKLLSELYTGMLNERMREYLQDPKSPFIYAYNYYGGFLARNGDAYTLTASIKENMITEGLKMLLSESERVKRYGFQQSELDRMKEDMLMRYEKQSKEYDKTESGRLASQYVSHYLSGRLIAGATREYLMVKHLIGDIQLDEINARATAWVTAENIAVVITAPEKKEIAIPTEADVLKILEESRTAKLDPYIDKFKPEPLLEKQLAGSPVKERKPLPEMGAEELTLGNGIKVVIKSTDFKNDEILFAAVSPGGTSLYPDADYMSALFAAQIIAEGGVGKFDNVALKKKLKGKSIELNPYIDDVKEGFSGKTNPKDLETLLQLTYLYFTAPNKDTIAFNANISRTKNQLKFVGNNPVFAFMDTLIKTSSCNDPRVVVLPRESQLDQINLDKMYAMYTDRFADAGDFTFLLVGNINADTLLPLLEKYLGSLPNTGRKESWKDESAPFPAVATNVTIRKGSEPKAMVGLVFQDRLEWTEQNRMYLRMLKEIASIQLIEVIREEMSGVYSPRVQITAEKYPNPEFSLMIQFGCSPQNTEKLTKAVFSIFDKLRKKGPDADDLKKVKELLLRERETDVKNNKWWLTRLENVYFNQDDYWPTATYIEKVNAVTSKELKDAAGIFFKKDRYVRAVLLPEKK